MIDVENLIKEFGPKRAVNGVSFTIRRGEILGFLGPNGAGKSTTMRMITGFFPPTSGRVRIGGHDMAEEPIAAKKLIGYLPESAPCYSDMTVNGFLRFTAELRGMRGAQIDAAVAKVAGLCFLEGVLHQSVDTLSKGYRHRTCFAQSILHDPEVLVLDEPTDGLDPNQKHEVRQIIKRMGQTKAIIFSTHILEEVEACCSRAIIIDRGTVVANGTPAELKARAETAGSVHLRVRNVAAETLKSKLAHSRWPDGSACRTIRTGHFPHGSSRATNPPGPTCHCRSLRLRPNLGGASMSCTLKKVVWTTFSGQSPSLIPSKPENNRS